MLYKWRKDLHKKRGLLMYFAKSSKMNSTYLCYIKLQREEEYTSEDLNERWKIDVMKEMKS